MVLFSTSEVYGKSNSLPFREDQDRLMFSGTNGMTLTADEIAVARYVAQGLLDGVR